MLSSELVSPVCCPRLCIWRVVQILQAFTDSRERFQSHVVYGALETRWEANHDSAQIKLSEEGRMKYKALHCEPPGYSTAKSAQDQQLDLLSALGLRGGLLPHLLLFPVRHPRVQSAWVTAMHTRATDAGMLHVFPSLCSREFGLSERFGQSWMFVTTPSFTCIKPVGTQHPTRRR